MGQTVIENYLLIHTERNYFPLLPWTVQIQFETLNEALSPKDKKAAFVC